MDISNLCKYVWKCWMFNRMEGKCKELEKKNFLNVMDKVNCESDLS